jgi:hypothetical protein
MAEFDRLLGESMKHAEILFKPKGDKAPKS